MSSLQACCALIRVYKRFSRLECLRPGMPLSGHAFRTFGFKASQPFKRASLQPSRSRSSLSSLIPAFRREPFERLSRSFPQAFRVFRAFSRLRLSSLFFRVCFNMPAPSGRRGRQLAVCAVQADQGADAGGEGVGGGEGKGGGAALSGDPDRRRRGVHRRLLDLAGFH